MTWWFMVHPVCSLLCVWVYVEESRVLWRLTNSWTEGYTGQLIAEHITAHLPTNLNWAIAGRSHDKPPAIHLRHLHGARCEQPRRDAVRSGGRCGHVDDSQVPRHRDSVDVIGLTVWSRHVVALGSDRKQERNKWKLNKLLRKHRGNASSWC